MSLERRRGVRGPLTSGRQIGADQVALGILAALAGVGIAALLASRTRTASYQQDTKEQERIRAARHLNRAAGMLAFSVLADSAIEHYRGSFHNKAMFTPLIVSSITLAVSMHGIADRRGRKHPVRDCAYLGCLLTGAAGTGFHVYNVVVTKGGLNWQNVFYGAPLGAPAAIALSGLFGAAAERIRDEPTGEQASLLGRSAGQMISGAASVALLGTMGEAGLLHFRGAFHNPFMFAPVTLPILASAALARSACAKTPASHGLTRWLLRLTAAMGIAGSGFHAYGVHRNMGGWRNWRQNLLNGPPIPAPPSFTGLALAGLAGLELRESEERA